MIFWAFPFGSGCPLYPLLRCGDIASIPNADIRSTFDICLPFKIRKTAYGFIKPNSAILDL